MPLFRFSTPITVQARWADPLRQKSLQQTRVDGLERTAEFNSTFIEIRMDQQREHQVEGARRLVVGVAPGEYPPGLATGTPSTPG